MTRRLVALALWSYFAWYLGAMLASVTGLPLVVGPMAALATAAVGLLGWRRSVRRVADAPSTRIELQPTR